MSFLLDVNLLIALAWPTHVHHTVAQQWFRRKVQKGWASCPITQTAFVRISSNPKFIDGAVSPNEAISLLTSVTSSKYHQFWPDDIPFTQKTPIPLGHLVGHRQITDAYLIGLVVKHQAKLATLDPGIKALLPKSSESEIYLEVIHP